MHPIGWIILTFILFSTILELTSDLLNLSSLRLKVPRAFEGWYDAHRYAKSQRYLRVNTWFGWVGTTFNLALLLFFWLCGGFACLDQWVHGFQMSPVPSGLLYIGLIVGIKGVLGLPFGIYATFVIEARFGFNKTTWRTYVTDRIKGLALTGVVGGAMLAVVLAFFQYAREDAWWYCWVATTLMMLVLQYIAPTWIMPLFNRFEPLPAGELRDAILAYAKGIDFELENIFVMDGSKRSSKSNAFFTGFGRHRRIVLFDTLIEKHTVDELVAVLAHEMGHYKCRHILKNLAIGIGHTGVLFYILAFFISYPGLFAAFYVDHVSIHAGLIFFGLLYAPLDALTGIALQALSRRFEYQADGFCVDTSEHGAAMVTALKKLSVDNLSNLQPHPFHVLLNNSHPPVLQRIEAIEKRLADGA